jgi:hydroxymethylglutaryl-CoA lyase
VSGQVTVVEVGPRDGLQNEPDRLPTEVKIDLIRRLVAAGATVVEATSFVRPDRIPQLADAGEVVAALDHGGEVRYPVLVPNLRGLDDAIAAGVQEVAIFAAASDAFSRSNLGRDVEASLEMFHPVVAGALEAGLRVRAYVSTAWGCPFQGAVDSRSVLYLATTFAAWGCDELCFGDTIGVASPADVRRLLRDALRDLPAEKVAVHLHDTYGQGLANALEAIDLGITTVDTALGGLGGCPYAGPSASGNLATEDLVYALNRAGVRTGLSLEALVETSWWLAGHTRRPPVSRVARALEPTS